MTRKTPKCTRKTFFKRSIMGPTLKKINWTIRKSGTIMFQFLFLGGQELQYLVIFFWQGNPKVTKLIFHFCQENPVS